jgi:predicted nucleic acid-binding protein
LFDADVLYKIPIVDLVLELTATGLFRCRWSEDIHQEWIRAIVKNRPDLPMDSIQRRCAAMDKWVPDALVDGYQPLIPSLTLPDPEDRHVVAAAIVGRADVIVTYNLKYFPDAVLGQFGIEAQHPDVFLNHQRTLNETLFITCVKSVKSRLSAPKYSAQGYIDHLRDTCQLQVVAAELERVKGLL